MHPRKYIREKVCALLVAANTPVGASVYSNRCKPFIDAEGWQSQLPAINVSFSAEQTALHTAAPMEFKRVPSIEVSIYAATGQDDPPVDDFLDDVAEQVEIALGRYDWQTEGIDFDLGASRFELVQAPGDAIYAVLTIAFPMAYYSLLPDEGKAYALADFLTADNNYQVGEKLSHQTVKLP